MLCTHEKMTSVSDTFQLVATPFDEWMFLYSVTVAAQCVVD